MDKGKIILYKNKIKVRLKGDTVWLSQAQMAKLFDKNKRTISEHIQNIFKEHELQKDSVVRKFRITALDGKKYLTNFYNLDVIISVGYRVKSLRGTQFRIWATQVLRNYIIKGYAIDQKRLQETKLQELEKAISLLQRVVSKKQLKQPEAVGLLKVISDYANSWILLQKYDEGKLKIKKPTKSKCSLGYAEAQNAVAELKKTQIGSLFGQERDNVLEGILINISQSFSNKEIYPSIEEKAAHLLYFLIKDHPFSDGNKRIGSLLFLVYLAKNDYLLNKKGERKFNDNALVALALLIAESDPKEKDVMIKLVMNFLNRG